MTDGERGQGKKASREISKVNKEKNIHWVTRAGSAESEEFKCNSLF